MDVAEHVEQLRQDGERLAEVATSTPPSASVPTCPDWQLRDLVRHLGGVHRWATGFVQGEGRQPPDGDLEMLVGGWPPDADLVAWFHEGHRALVEALEAAPVDLETWTFLDAPSPLAFWARRQAHETAIHRVDAESAAGDVTGFPPAFAADGVDELLLGFVSRPGSELGVESPRSMLIRAADVHRSWGVTFAPSGFQILADPSGLGVPADVKLEVTGEVADLYVALWNRRDFEGMDLQGEPQLLDLWRDAVRISWS